MSNETLDDFANLLPTERIKVPSGYYVYSLFLEDYGIAYIGKGTGLRAWDHTDNIYKIVRDRLNGKISKRESVVYTGIIKLMLRHRWKLSVRIIYEGLTENEAFSLEEFLIKKHGRIIDSTGRLFNLADGGNVIVGQGYIEAKKSHEYGERRKILTQSKSKRQRPGAFERKFSKEAFGEFGKKVH